MNYGKESSSFLHEGNMDGRAYRKVIKMVTALDSS